MAAAPPTAGSGADLAFPPGLSSLDLTALACQRLTGADVIEALCSCPPVATAVTEIIAWKADCAANTAASPLLFSRSGVQRLAEACPRLLRAVCHVGGVERIPPGEAFIKLGGLPVELHVSMCGTYAVYPHGGEEERDIVLALEANVSITSLDASSTSAPFPLLSRRSVNAAELATALAVNTRLASLSMASTELTHVGVALLAAPLGANTGALAVQAPCAPCAARTYCTRAAACSATRAVWRKGARYADERGDFEHCWGAKWPTIP